MCFVTDDYKFTQRWRVKQHFKIDLGKPKAID